MPAEPLPDNLIHPGVGQVALSETLPGSDKTVQLPKYARLRHVSPAPSRSAVGVMAPEELPGSAKAGGEALLGDAAVEMDPESA